MIKIETESVVGQMLRTDGRAVETKEPAAFEDAVDDGVGEVVVVKDISPTSRVFVRCEDHRSSANVSVVDDVVEHVCGIIAVGEVANLVDNEDVRFYVNCKCLTQATVAARGREFVDELAAVTKRASKPFCSARYAIAIARCVLPRPGLPSRMTECPSVTKSGVRSEPIVVRRRVD